MEKPYDIFSAPVIDGENPKNPEYAPDGTLAQDAPTLGLGFHKFDGKTPVDEVIKQIGADFNVKKSHLVRIPDDVYDILLSGGSDPVLINPQDLITSHYATVNEKSGQTIGVVGANYGIIQNSQAFDILNVITDASESGADMSIVSAGLVHDHEPYMQISLPTDGLRITGDDSPTNFYAFVHTSHDGSSQLKVSFSAIRVVCRNTFMANMKAIGFAVRHSKNAGDRVDMTREANVRRVREFVQQTNLFKQEYIDKMNALQGQNVDRDMLGEFLTRIFVAEDTQKSVRENNYRFNTTEVLPTATKNRIDKFMNVLESGEGQNTNRGTKLWLFNGLTNYFSNTMSYGNSKDSDLQKATKRFDALSEGHAMRRTNEALNYLVTA